MPNLNVTLSQPHVEDRMKKVLMVEETMDTPNHHIFLYGIQNDSPLACILFAYYFKQIASELHQDCTTLLLIYKYRSGVKEKSFCRIDLLFCYIILITTLFSSVIPFMYILV